MEERLLKFVKKNTRFALGACTFALLVIAGGSYTLYALYGGLTDTRAQLEETKTTLEGTVDGLEENNRNLSEALYSEQQKNSNLEVQLQSVSEAVGNLEKWKKLDPELLQKYSKVYFLNENYVPSALSDISDKYLAEARVKDDKDNEIHSRVLPHLERMLNRAANDNMNIEVASAYRSFGEQSSLKSTYSLTYGAGTANQFSADQGYSEHQLGTTVDLATPETVATLTGFESTKEYRWLLDNAYRYGFALSYPENNSYYVFESWHWRFVGEKLSTYLHDQDVHFYDLDQRTIDEYLVNIFD